MATYCVTGGSGSLGSALTHALLADGHKVRTISRNEHRISALEASIPADARSHFSALVGDVRDRYRMWQAFQNVDYVIHAAALKGVGRCEYDPVEAIKTNIEGTYAVANAALDCKVKRAVFISSDKACAPHNLYGMTKATAERAWLACNRYAAGVGTQFLAVRWGNVFYSQGSVLHGWLAKLKAGAPLVVTDPEATRFSIRMEQAVEFVLRALEKGVEGDVYIPELRSYRVGDLAKALGTRREQWDVVGLQPGEKKHETLLTDFEAPYAVRRNGWIELRRAWQGEGVKGYMSGNCGGAMTVEELQVEIQQVVGSS